MSAASEVDPRDRARVDRWLEARGRTWPPGPSFAVRRGMELAAVARSFDASPGDGYHRAHVRSLEVEGAGEDLAPALRLAVDRAGQDVRLEAEAPSSRLDLVVALEAAGLALEARLPGGWKDERGTSDLILFGRAACDARTASVPWPAAPRAPVLRAAWRVAIHTAATRPTLARFLDALVPGRAHPPGTLLSDAEAIETRRPGDLDAPWALALDDDGEVVGGAILEQPRGPHRSHVARVHVDVAAAFRGLGVASALVRAAVRHAATLGLERVEADPLGGNAGACRALAACLAPAGVQRRAWRLRTATASWDEDVILYSAPAGSAIGPAGRQDGDSGP